VALAEEGPTPSLTSLAREHEGIVRRLGDRRLQALLVVDPLIRTVRTAAADPRIVECVSLVQSALAEGDVRAAAKALEELAPLVASDRSAREALGAQAEPLLLALKSKREKMHPRTLAALERRLTRIFAHEPWVIQAVSRQRELEGNLVAALNFYAELSDRAPGAAPALLHAATLAVGLGREAEAWEFARRASAAAPDDRRMATALSDLFVRHGRTERAIEFWRETDQAGSLRLWARLGLVRTLELAGDRGGVLSETIRTVREAPLLSDMAAPDLNMLVDIVRHLVQSQSRAPNLAGLDELASLLLQKEPPSPLRAWMLANVDLARPDLERALAQFDEGIDLGPPPDGIPLDHHAEKALALQRYHRFGDAYAAWETADQEKVKANGHYARRREFLRQVVELCAGDPRRLLYPECLFDILFEEIARSPPKREGHAGHVVMVSGSLGQGGGERQTITVVRRMIGEGRLEKLSLLVRSTHMRDHDDFFLSRVAELPVDLTIYGADWQRRSNIAELLPEFADRPKIVAAIDLMPTNSREEVARLCRQLFDRRPQAVHVWQDIPYAAVACALVGIRHFFVHRGSLAPDYWAQSDYQTATHFRPMRHIYRRLLERSDFVLLNNSVSGCETDQKWLGWPSAEPFQVVYNAVDFSQLGEHVGRNLALRRELGIPDDAPVIGGSFRIVAVKRPLYWIEAARQIREAVPNAHFLIIGDGDMTEEVAAFAFEHGFGEALHLPGRVANVGDWYRAMDLKLMTSEREGIPNAIIEAQHFGVPIVATHVGGIHEAIDPGQTGHVTPGDNGPEPYAAQVIASLRDSAWHEAAREKAPRFVHDKFSLDTVVERLMHYYGMNAAGIPAPGMIDGLSGSDVAGARR
jgi:glycosyltransferase involved in cell wall biosynthesis